MTDTDPTLTEDLRRAGYRHHRAGPDLYQHHIYSLETDQLVATLSAGDAWEWLRAKETRND